MTYIFPLSIYVCIIRIIFTKFVSMLCIIAVGGSSCIQLGRYRRHILVFFYQFITLLLIIVRVIVVFIVLNFITQANGSLLCSYIVKCCGNVKWPQVTVLTETSTT